MINDSSYDDDRAMPVGRIEQRPSFSQQEERTKLAAAIRELLVEFSSKTGLVVEDIDIELNDTFFYWNPALEKQTHYQAIQVKAVLP